MKISKEGIKSKNNKGITLVALVVTIIVLLILAGVTLSSVLSQNGIFSRAEKARVRNEIAQLKEALEMVKNPVLIDGVGTIDKDQYFDEIQREGLINDKTKDVVDNGDNTYDVTTKPGYVFLIELLPNKENPRDIKVEYIGEVGKILPIIRKIEVSATSTSITGKATVSRLGTNGTVDYYYKLETEEDEDYKKMAKINDEIGATQDSNIVAGTKYIIKVVAKNEVGEVNSTKDITATKVFVESITLNKITETVAVGTITTLIATVKPDNATNKNLIWQSSNKDIATVSENGVVTVKKAGTAEIIAKAIDGSGKSASYIVTAKSISLNKTTETVGIGNIKKLIATVLPENISNENLNWKSENTKIATVDNNGNVKGISIGTTIITVSIMNENNITTKCEITVTETDWELMNKIAKVIAQDNNVNRTSQSVEANVDGIQYTLSVGDEYVMKFNESYIKLRIIGFKHDELSDKYVYRKFMRLCWHFI